MCILGDIRSKATSEHAVTVEATNANSPQVEPLRRRPPTIAELVERAQDPPWDPTKSLRHWLRTAEKARKDGNRHAEHQNHGSAFVEYARAALIIFEKLPTHQEYPTLLRVDQRQNLELNGQDILQSLSQLKPILKDEYKQWLATRSTAADRSRPSKNERSVDRKRNAR
ncbi:hypothetical protein DAEQUDRAFT_130553 [Daedalea quercina L-15889]|uniref:USP8 dimerisation domain-containing protein n=1 Tax=Daedalea quercina L-15889 TaxID=1314783 RepID=A0A165S1S3_9APHY|nr:hypothetical protein DAEQUDRAFT_130553 [Daedalea quercina L-15889]